MVFSIISKLSFDINAFFYCGLQPQSLKVCSTEKFSDYYITKSLEKQKRS